MSYRTLTLSHLLLMAVLPSEIVGQQADEDTVAVNARPIRVLRIDPDRPKTPTVPKDHPLLPVLRIAEQHHQFVLDNVRDYTCLLIKRERIDGKLRPAEHARVKCRNPRTTADGQEIPFSVYMRFTAPEDLAGREALHVANRDRGDVLVRKGGRRNPYLNLWVDPHSDLALRDNRYPITELGIENLLFRLMQVGRDDLRYNECQVRYHRNVTVAGRDCTAIEVEHPVRRDHFLYHQAHIMVDNELHVPIYFAAYSWPQKPGGNPVLMEQYTYQDMRLNVGLRDIDFDRLNPEYGFRKD